MAKLLWRRCAIGQIPATARFRTYTPEHPDEHDVEEQQMPKIIVQANHDGDAGRVTLSERVVATHLQDEHYAAQLIERLAWAAIDAERLESPSDGEQTGERRGLRPARPPGEAVSSRPRTSPAAGARRARP
ncbi:MAG: hypothetical protein ACXVH3_36120 [Solirubrobacteraceae bacterium]